MRSYLGHSIGKGSLLTQFALQSQMNDVLQFHLMKFFLFCADL